MIWKKQWNVVSGSFLLFQNINKYCIIDDTPLKTYFWVFLFVSQNDGIFDGI